MKGIITTNNSTKGHQKWLEDHGYKVSAKEGFIEVEVESIDSGSFSGNEEEFADFLRHVVKKKGCLSYTFRTYIGGKTRFGRVLCKWLGETSALVMKKEKEKPKKFGAKI